MRSRTFPLPLIFFENEIVKNPLNPAYSFGKGAGYSWYFFLLTINFVGDRSIVRKLTALNKDTVCMPTLLSPTSSSIKTPPRSFDFQEALDTNFPGAFPGDAFVNFSSFQLHHFGTEKKNAIACVSVCRHKIVTPFMNRIHNAWNGAFAFSSLAGMLYLGVTSFQAIHHYAPNTNGREQDVYFAFHHNIATDEYGIPGKCHCNNPVGQ